MCAMTYHSCWGRETNAQVDRRTLNLALPLGPLKSKGGKLGQVIAWAHCRNYSITACGLGMDIARRVEQLEQRLDQEENMRETLESDVKDQQETMEALLEMLDKTITLEVSCIQLRDVTAALTHVAHAGCTRLACRTGGSTEGRNDNT
eukprot:COSAG05_NODE_234_length_13214_cov_161.696454_5_plen_148_part_00